MVEDFVLLSASSSGGLGLDVTSGVLFVYVRSCMSACYAVSPSGRFGPEGQFFSEVVAATTTVACSWLVMLVFMHLRCVPSACLHAGTHGIIGGFAAVAACRRHRHLHVPAGFAGIVASAVFASWASWTGQEVAALVVDLGSFMSKACFASFDATCAVFSFLSAGPVTLLHGGMDQKDSCAVTSVMGLRHFIDDDMKVRGGAFLRKKCSIFRTPSSWTLSPRVAGTPEEHCVVSVSSAPPPPPRFKQVAPFCAGDFSREPQRAHASLVPR